MEDYTIEKHKARLSEIEKEHSVKILFALESGSRAWGFESIDSDYDVRFIYCNLKDWYLSVMPKRDVIEYPIIDLFDYSGWDLKKAFFLMNKSNPVLFEWLKSPIVYFKEQKFFDIFTDCAKLYFSPVSSIYHYLHMANGNYREFLQNDYVKIKKYFYVLRPVLACMWIEHYNETPPVEFEKLLQLEIEKDVLDEILILLQKKRSGVELGLEPKIRVINDFLDKQINYFGDNSAGYHSRQKQDIEYLNRKFVELLNIYG